MFPKTEGPRYTKDMWVSAAFTLFTAFLALGLRILLVCESKKLALKYGPKLAIPRGDANDPAFVETAVGEENYGPNFRFMGTLLKCGLVDEMASINSTSSLTLCSLWRIISTSDVQADGKSYLLAANMCYDVIEKFPCGHEDKTLIPCEGLFETGTCSGREPDKSRDSDEPKCAECQQAAAEEEHLQKQLQEFAIKDSLEKPPVAPRVRDPNAPKKYFKWCIEWERCKHRSHSRPSDIERDDDDEYEYLTVPGIGQCYDCSKAPDRKIAEMKQNGEYAKKDPWGALSRVEIAAGSPKDSTPQSLEKIAGHGSYSKEHQAEDGFLIAPSLSAEDSDDDTGASKGKGRAGEPLAPHVVKAAAEPDESDESDEEGQAGPVKKAAKETTNRTTKQSGKEAADDSENTEDEDDEEQGSEEEDEEDEKPAPLPNWSSASGTHPLANAQQTDGATKGGDRNES
ncbi:MAG: hypothetical protein Q9226_007419 [Calogaya cf. arnoldii]